MPTGQFGDELRALRASQGNRPPTVPSNSTSPEDETLPDEQPGGSSMAYLNDLLTGGAKGAGMTVGNLGAILRMIPGMDALDKIAPPMDFDIEPKNDTQKLGKNLEQMAEFFLPVSKLARVKGATMVANKMPAMGKAATKAYKTLAFPAAKMGGEALGAGAISAVHGDENPEHAAEMGAGGMAAAELLPKMTRLLSTPIGKAVAPVMIASSALGALPNMTGLGASMGMYSVIKGPIKKALNNPTIMRNLEYQLGKGGEKLAKVGEGMVDNGKDLRRPGERSLPEPAPMIHRTQGGGVNRDLEQFILKMIEDSGGSPGIWENPIRDPDSANLLRRRLAGQ